MNQIRNNLQSVPMTPTIPSGCTACSQVLQSVLSCPTVNSYPSNFDQVIYNLFSDLILQWRNTGNQIAKCLCPILKNPSTDACAICIQTGPESQSPATQLFIKLKADCNLGALPLVRDKVLTVFNVTLPESRVTKSSPPAANATKVPEKKNMGHSLIWNQGLMMTGIMLLVKYNS